MTPLQISRREFLRHSATSGSVLAAGLMPATILGANDRINFGLIGLGNMGTGHLRSLTKRSETDNIRCLAVSDVYQKRLTRSREIMGGGDGYLDYRRLIDRKDIDAICAMHVEQSIRSARRSAMRSISCSSFMDASARS